MLFTLLHIEFHIVSSLFLVNETAFANLETLFGKNCAPVFQRIFDSEVALEEVLIAAKNNELLKGKSKVPFIVHTI